MKQKFINNIIKETLPVLLKGVNENDYVEIQNAYENYILSTYNNIDINERNYEQLFSAFLNSELAFLESMTIVHKKSFFLKDENMEKIIKLSNSAMDLKLNAVKNKEYISKEEAVLKIEEMQQLLNFVKPYNGEVAQQYLSEGILDYNYAAGLSEDNSFRTANYFMAEDEDVKQI